MGIFGRWMGVGVLVGMMAGVGLAQEDGAGRGDLGGIVGRLGSEEFAVRERGQRELEGVAAERVGEVRKLMGEAAERGEPEVVARLGVRVREMEEYLAVHPGKISVAVKGVNLAGLGKAMSEAMGEEDGGMITTAGGEGMGITFRAEGAGFWEVMQRLQDEQHLGFHTTERGYSLRAGEGEPVAAVGALAAYGWVMREVTVPPRWWLNVTLMMDPRVRVAAVSGVKWTEMADERGLDLLPLVEATESQELVKVTGFGWTKRTLLRVAPSHGKVIARARGEVRMVVGVGETRAVVEDVGERMFEPEGALYPPAIALGELEGRVTGPEGRGMSPSKDLVVHLKSKGKVPEGAKEADVFPMEYRVTDGRGMVVGEQRSEGMVVRIHIDAGAVGRMRLEVRGAEREVEVGMGVEVRGVVLP